MMDSARQRKSGPGYMRDANFIHPVEQTFILQKG